ncbi:MAG: ABC transporter ATP-binding protein [Chloroflexota bacterium]|nr:ABC transporter ATP-binding protein [Chloroflexota bacterium]
MLTIDGLHAAYGDSVALDGVSLNVVEGDVFGVLGANGAGKTTLLRAISGLRPPTARGSIRFDGVELLGQRAESRARIGIAHVPEGRRVFASMTVRDNLLLGAYGKGSNAQRAELERTLATFPELANRIEQRAGSLSGGEQQMLAIGRALMCRPRLLLLDEPSLGLAPIVVARVFRLLESLHTESRLTVVLVEQNATEALRLLDRGCVIDRGRIAASGERHELTASAALTAAYLGAASTEPSPN